MAVYSWELRTGAASWRPRDGAGMLSFGGSLYLLGGWRYRVDVPSGPGGLIDDGFTNRDGVKAQWTVDSEVWRSDDDGRSWVCASPRAPWAGRHSFGYVVHDGKMWIVGGDIYSDTNDVWCSSGKHDGTEWECVSEVAPWAPRAMAYVAAFGGFIWVVGGLTAPQFQFNGRPARPELLYDDCWRSVDGAEWECVATACPWGPRGMIGGSGAVKDGYLWLISGGTYETDGKDNRLFCNDVWRTKDGADWELVLAAAPWQARQYAEIAVWDEKLFLLEGYGVDSSENVVVPMGGFR
eukprot:SAG11_NODE_2715_length_3051_cov_5.943089_1_plen_294_part_00